MINPQERIRLAFQKSRKWRTREMAKAVQNCVQGVQDHNRLLCRDVCTYLRFGGHQAHGSTSLCFAIFIVVPCLCRCVLASSTTRTLHCGDPCMDKKTSWTHPGDDLAFEAMFARTAECWIEMV